MSSFMELVVLNRNIWYELGKKKSVTGSWLYTMQQWPLQTGITADMHNENPVS